MSSHFNIAGQPLGVLRPFERLIGDVDLRNLPEADDLDEMILRIEALEQHIQSTQTAMSARIASLSAALDRAETKHKQLTPLATLSALTPAIVHDLATAVSNFSLVAESMGQEFAAFNEKVARGDFARSELDDFLRSCGEGLQILASASTRTTELTLSLKNISIDGASERQRSFTLSALVEDVLTMLRPTLRPLPIAVTTAISEEIVLDHLPGPISQILINLIQNALLHAFDGTRPAKLNIDARLCGEHVQLWVADNGIGMVPAVLEKIFVPYFTTRKDKGGSGVGLTHSRHLAEEKLGGVLRAESTPGEGSRFCLEIAQKRGR